MIFFANSNSLKLECKSVSIRLRPNLLRLTNSTPAPLGRSRSRRSPEKFRVTQVDKSLKTNINDEQERIFTWFEKVPIKSALSNGFDWRRATPGIFTPKQCQVCCMFVFRAPIDRVQRGRNIVLSTIFPFYYTCFHRGFDFFLWLIDSFYLCTVLQVQKNSPGLFLIRKARPTQIKFKPGARTSSF